MFFISNKKATLWCDTWTFLYGTCRIVKSFIDGCFVLFQVSQNSIYLQDKWWPQVPVPHEGHPSFLPLPATAPGPWPLNVLSYSGMSPWWHTHDTALERKKYIVPLICTINVAKMTYVDHTPKSSNTGVFCDWTAFIQTWKVGQVRSDSALKSHS